MHVVVLAPRPEILADRDRRRGRRGDAGWSADEFDRHLREETPRLGLCPDTSALTVEETVDRVLGGLPAALVEYPV